MSTLKHFFGLGLIGLLSLNVYATDGDANSTSSSANEASLTKLNHNLVRLLDVNEMENPTGGVAILKYAIDELGRIKILNVEATDDDTNKYVYRHLEGKKVKLADGVIIGEHSLTVHIKSGY